MANRFRAWVRKNQKYGPVIFFICGFIWDTLTLGRIDRLYDRIILFTYLSSLSVSIYMFNVMDDGRWKGTFIEKFEEYLPLAIQFFLGGLCSAYVIYFSRSVSLTKTLLFFIILVFLLFANELLKKRISNKYLQFSAYFFVNFTFFTFYIPVLIKEMNTIVFLISGAISLSTTIFLITYIYYKSPSTRVEIHRGKMLGIVAGIYLMINTFYYLNLIPPVPLALDKGMVAYNVERTNGDYTVTHKQKKWYTLWEDSNLNQGESVYVFTSIFAPTDLEKAVSHRWKWLNQETGDWEVADNISYQITGGRDSGYRGFTYKNNLKEGKWRVDVITSEGLVIGIVNFILEFTSDPETDKLVTEIM